MAYHSRLSLEQVASRRVRENKPIGNNIAFRDSVHKTSKEYKSSKNFALTYTPTWKRKKEKGKHASSTESQINMGTGSMAFSIREKQTIFYSSRIPY
jgi:hypothetical protein